MKERTTAKATELYATIVSFIAAKQPIEVADLEASELTFVEGPTRVEQRAIFRSLVEDVNKAVQMMRDGENKPAIEEAVMITEEYREHFHDDPVQSQRDKRAAQDKEDSRELADRILRKK